ncbi:hypothetical protein C7M84_001792, partial [Penaeus vannamei]
MTGFLLPIPTAVFNPTLSPLLLHRSGGRMRIRPRESLHVAPVDPSDAGSTSARRLTARTTPTPTPTSLSELLRLSWCTASSSRRCSTGQLSPSSASPRAPPRPISRGRWMGSRSHTPTG